MKSKFFKDTQGLGECYTRCPPGQVCICLRMDRCLYEQLLCEAGQYGMTSGQYIQQLMAWHGNSAAHSCPPHCPQAPNGCVAETMVLNQTSGHPGGQGRG